MDSGAILRMEPNYNNNIALFARGVLRDLSRANDKLISLFLDLLESDDRALDIAKQLPFPIKEMIESCASHIRIAVDGDALCAFIINGSDRIQARIR